MKLSKIISGIKYAKLINFKDVNILSLAHNSKNCESGALFFCLNGEKYCGLDFAKEAIKNGACAIVSEKEIAENIPQIIVENSRIAMSESARVFYDYPDKKLKIISIVGTNGKTTISHILCKILNVSGKNCGIIGTNGIFMNDLELPSELTTPDPIELYYTLNQMVVLNFEYVVLEASAHAIALNKLYGLGCEACIFSNISSEHLDFFKTIEEYAQVKINYVNSKNSKHIIVNADDEYGKKVLRNAKVPYSTYGIFNPASTFAIDIKTSMRGSTFLVNSNDEIMKISTKLVGDFNVYNILSAIACSKYLGISNSAIVKGIYSLKNVDGRFNVFELSKNRKIVVDFAHTPDGFEKTLCLVKKMRKGKIKTLFGCVGYSDISKRGEMGRIASKYSDEIVLTVDNIKNAKFNEINSDIIKGIENFIPIKIIYDRKTAVKQEIANLKTNETLILLGKGSEKFQKIGDDLIEYCEQDFVNEIVNKLNK